MIGRLRGVLVHQQAPFVLIDVGGVGYEIEATSAVLSRLPHVGSECTIYTHMIVRDDAHLLFGFADLAERELFRDLIKVNGVGARMALAIISGMAVEEFARCIRDKDATTLMRLPGVGRKSADRLIMELQDRIADYWSPEATPVAAARPAQPGGDALQEALVALAALGYKPHEANRMLAGIDAASRTSEEIIRHALQQAVIRTP
ncbi:MAG: Holliday junction branch migration protein RuvA [Gammaproteobacteria bacterium]|nr:Holliday junction branch migration protein RuvA [Gammaproteobacteria bacterium]